MHDQVDDNVAEERGFELLSFLELLGRLARLSQHARPDGRQVMPKLTIRCSGSLFAPATLLQNTAGQVSGFLSQADEQPGAAAVSQHGAHFGSLSRHPADGAVNQYVHHLPSATLLPHDVVQNIPLTGSRGDLGLYDPIATGGPDG